MIVLLDDFAQSLLVFFVNAADLAPKHIIPRWQQTSKL